MDVLEHLADVVHGLFTNKPECMYILTKTSTCNELSALREAVTNKDAVKTVNLLGQIINTCLILTCNPGILSMWPEYMYTCMKGITAALCTVSRRRHHAIRKIGGDDTNVTRYCACTGCMREGNEGTVRVRIMGDFSVICANSDSNEICRITNRHCSTDCQYCV